MLPRLLLLLALLLPLTGAAQTTPFVPDTLTFCGMHLRLLPGAKHYIGQQVKRLSSHAPTLAVLTERAVLYMPYVEDALRHAGMPEDLKYIVIQESGLLGNAVSASNAVGYWQFKYETAVEMGLHVGETVDERRHITRATLGAAQYFTRAYVAYENWVYAVTSYMNGTSGTLPFAHPELVGADEMVIDTSNTHWYALKAIAHKLVFGEAMAKAHPTLRLEARTAENVADVQSLVKVSGLSLAELRKYNTWLLRGWGSLPKGRPVTYFVAVPYKTPHKADPNLDVIPAPNPERWARIRADIHDRITREGKGKLLAPADRLAVRNQPVPPVKQPEKTTQQEKPAARPEAPKPTAPTLDQEPTLNKAFTYAHADETVAALAKRLKTDAKKLLRYNPGIKPGEKLAEGRLVLLVASREVQYHIVQPGETLIRIGAFYNLSSDLLARRNHLHRDAPLEAGRRLYLQVTAPEGVAPTIYALGTPQPASVQETTPPQQRTTPLPDPRTVAQEERPTQPAMTGNQPAGNAQRSLPDPRAVSFDESTAPAVSTNAVSRQFTLYTVQKGDTLEAIAQRFRMTPAEVLKANDLTTAQAVKPGIKLLVRLQEGR